MPVCIDAPILIQLFMIKSRQKNTELYCSYLNRMLLRKKRKRKWREKKKQANKQNYRKRRKNNPNTRE